MAYYNSRGNINLISGDVGSGLHSTSGAIRVTIVDGNTLTGLFASDGSWNIVLVSSSDTPQGLYHTCGAYRIVSASSELGVYAPNGAWYGDSSGLIPDGALAERDEDLILLRNENYILSGQRP